MKSKNIEKMKILNCLDISKIKKNIGWKPKVNISQGIKKTIDYYKKKINA